MQYIQTLNNHEIERVNGGGWQFVAVAIAATAIVDAANKIIEAGEALHDAVCTH